MYVCWALLNIRGRGGSVSQILSQMSKYAAWKVRWVHVGSGPFHSSRPDSNNPTDWQQNNVPFVPGLYICKFIRFHDGFCIWWEAVWFPPWGRQTGPRDLFDEPEVYLFQSTAHTTNLQRHQPEICLICPVRPCVTLFQSHNWLNILLRQGCIVSSYFKWRVLCSSSYTP